MFPAIRYHTNEPPRTLRADRNVRARQRERVSDRRQIGGAVPLLGGCPDPAVANELSYAALESDGFLNGSGGDDPEILAVGRDGGTLHVQTCVPVRSGHDDAWYHSVLLRVRYEGEPPSSVVLSHWKETSGRCTTEPTRAA